MQKYREAGYCIGFLPDYLFGDLLRKNIIGKAICQGLLLETTINRQPISFANLLIKNKKYAAIVRGVWLGIA